MNHDYHTSLMNHDYHTSLMNHDYHNSLMNHDYHNLVMNQVHHNIASVAQYIKYTKHVPCGVLTVYGIGTPDLRWYLECAVVGRGSSPDLNSKTFLDSHLKLNSHNYVRFEHCQTIWLLPWFDSLGDTGYQIGSNITIHIANSITQAERIYIEAKYRIRNTAEIMFGICQQLSLFIVQIYYYLYSPWARVPKSCVCCFRHFRRHPK